MHLSSDHQVFRPSLISCEQPSQWGILGTRGIAIMCPCLTSFLVQYARDAIPTKPATKRHTYCRHLPEGTSQGLFRAVVSYVSSCDLNAIMYAGCNALLSPSQSFLLYSCNTLVLRFRSICCFALTTRKEGSTLIRLLEQSFQ